MLAELYRLSLPFADLQQAKQTANEIYKEYSMLLMLFPFKHACVIMYMINSIKFACANIGTSRLPWVLFTGKSSLEF